MSLADLHALLAVQDMDTAIDQRRHRRSHLPEKAELSSIDAEAATAGSKVAEVTATRDEMQSRQAKIEAELAATEDRAAAVSRRLYGGEVSASRELQAMAADVESLKARASVLEDQILAVMEERDPLDRQVADLQARLTDLDERRKAVAERVTEGESAIDAELSALEADRSQAIAAVPGGLLSTYERLRTRLGGVGAARLIGNHCDGCHLTLSAVELDRIRHLPDGEILTCEQCGRILVPTGSPS